MFLFRYLKEKPVPWADICEWSVLALLVASILWRGGKSLDMTWVLTGVICFTTIVSYCTSARSRYADTPIFLWGAVVAFIILNVMGLFVSETRNYGLDEVLRTGALGLALLWIIRLLQGSQEKDRYVHRLVHIFTLTVLFACGIGFLVYILQPVSRFAGTFFDYRFHTDYWPNAWADFLLLAWPLVLFATFREYRQDLATPRGRLEFFLRCAVIGFTFGCLFLSYSRGAVLVLIAQFAVWGALIYRKTRPAFPVKPVIPILLSVTALALVTFLGANMLRSKIYAVEDVAAKVTFTSAEGGSSVHERLQFWSQALNLSAKKPILGWGPYSFRFVQPSLQKGVLATSDHAHNVFLKLLMERGTPAALVFLLVLGLVIYRAGAMLLSRDVDIGVLLFSLRTYVFLGLGGVTLHNLIDFNMQFVGISLPFWLLLGILMSYLDIGSLRTISHKVARGMEVGIASVLLLIALYEGGYLVVSSLGRRAEASGDTAAALLWYDRAARGEYFTRDLHLSRAKIFFDQGKLPEAKAAVDAYIARNAEDFRAWKRDGEIAYASGDKQRALESYTRAFERGKWNDLGILRGLLDTYQSPGMNGEITKQRAMIDQILQSYADAIQANAHYVALSPNVEEFIALCNMLARLYPDDAPRYQVMAAKADHHAQIERGKIKARPPGFLW